MTPTPIPEWFETWIRNWLRENVVTVPSDKEDIDITLDRHNAKTTWAWAIAIAAYPVLASQQTMRWVKAKNELPDFGDEEFHLRCKRGDIMDRWTALYDESVKEFYMVKEYCIMDYFSLDDYPDIEWLLDESPASIQ